MRGCESNAKTRSSVFLFCFANTLCLKITITPYLITTCIERVSENNRRKRSEEKTNSRYIQSRLKVRPFSPYLVHRREDKSGKEYIYLTRFVWQFIDTIIIIETSSKTRFIRPSWERCSTALPVRDSNRNIRRACI